MSVDKHFMQISHEVNQEMLGDNDALNLGQTGFGLLLKV